jgi:hypothetical protein
MAAADESPKSSGAERPDAFASENNPAQLHTPIIERGAGVAMAPPVRLPASETPPPAELPVRVIARVDALLVTAVLLLALLLAFFPARNSDLWMHLAAGRSLAQGEFSFGANPFMPHAEGGRWVNHSWLYDFVSFDIYRIAGGPGLIVLKALVMVMLAAVLIRLGRVGRGYWMAAVCAGLAVLAVSSRLLLQPVCVSYLFFALTLWILEGRRRNGIWKPEKGISEESLASSVLSYWPLFVLFVFWVNLDSWFLLGPATVALYAIGQALQEWLGPNVDEPSGARRGNALVLGLVLIAGLAACLVNPYHVYAFRLPALINPFERASQPDALFPLPALTPFHGDYYRVTTGLNPAGMAYFPLIALGALSFGLNYASWRWRWALLWVGLLVMSGFQIRSVPFFAIAAGPIMALNFQEWFVRRREGRMQSGPPAWLGARFATLLGALVLVTAAWPGWLQSRPYDRRNWGVEPDSCLQNAAEQVSRWRKDGLLNEETAGFTFSPEAAAYFAWFCVEAGDAQDARLTLLPKTDADARAVRKALLGESDLPEGEDAQANRAGSPRADWRSVLRERHIDRLVMYDADGTRLSAPLRGLLVNSGEWPLLYIDGHTAVFGWRDPERFQTREPGTSAPDPFADLSVDFKRLAYHPAEEKKAPRNWPGRNPHIHEWWEAFVTPNPTRPLDRDEAGILLIQFEAARLEYSGRRGAEWLSSQAASIIGQTGFGEGAPTAAIGLTLRLRLAGALAGPKPGESIPPAPIDVLATPLWQNYAFDHDDGPPELALLAVRASRRAIHANPDDAAAYLNLGEAYVRLLRGTRERVWGKALPQFHRMRIIQAVAAYNYALQLKPDLAQAHFSLAGLYQEMEFADLTLMHLQEYLKATRAAGRQAGETAGQFKERIGALEDAVGRVDKEVKSRTENYLINSANYKVLDKARAAAKNGLAATARDILMASNVAAFGNEGTRLELGLMLSTGMVDKLREWRKEDEKEEWKDALGEYEFQLLQAQIEAATGDYEEADERLAKMTAAVAPSSGEKQLALSLRSRMALALGKTVLQGSSPDLGGIWQFWLRLGEFEAQRQVQGFAANLRQQADLTVVRGLLDLECGETQRAREKFDEALSVWRSDAAAAAGTGIEFSGRFIAQECLEKLASSGR